MDSSALVAGIILIGVVLGSRMVAVSLPVIVLKRSRAFSPGIIRILTWGGLRGGISVALALALPKEGIEDGVRQAILMATYIVVIFSIAVQGLTLKPVILRAMGKTAS